MEVWELAMLITLSTVILLVIVRAIHVWYRGDPPWYYVSPERKEEIAREARINRVHWRPPFKP